MLDIMHTAGFTLVSAKLNKKEKIQQTQKRVGTEEPPDPSVLFCTPLFWSVSAVKRQGTAGVDAAGIQTAAHL